MGSACRGPASALISHRCLLERQAKTANRLVSSTYKRRRELAVITAKSPQNARNSTLAWLLLDKWSVEEGYQHDQENHDR
jgi:hypothetical protein